MSETVKVRVYIETSKVGSRCEDEIEFTRAEWDAMTEDERDEAAKDAAFNYLEWGWSAND